MNFDKYIDIPFVANGNDINGCDCWRLICLVYREMLNIELPTFPEIKLDATKESLLKITRAFKENKQKWNSVKNPKPFDVVLIRTGNMLFHAGLVIGKGMMLHIDKGINSTIEKYTSNLWKKKIEGFYRYVE